LGRVGICLDWLNYDATDGDKVYLIFLVVDVCAAASLLWILSWYHIV